MSFPAPAIAQGIRQLKMVTDWPEDMPGLHTSAVRFAQTIGAATGGRIKIEVFPAGALVRPFETFDAVGAGVADMYHSYEGYFEKKSPAFQFFAAMPFGFTADELFAWVQYGGGQELWDALSGQFNIKPLLCTNTGCQMGGWFNREITSPEAFKGLRYRMAGPGAEVLRRLGAIVVTLAGRARSCRRSSPAPSTPANGSARGSTWRSACTRRPAITTIPASTSRAPAQRSASTRACGKASTRATGGSSRPWPRANTRARLAEFNANNALSLRKLRDEGTVKILKFDDSLLKAFLAISKDVVAEIGSGDELSKKIYASYQQFRASIMDWSDIAERAFLNSRAACVMGATRP